VRKGAVERAVVQPARRPAQSKAAETKEIFRMGTLLKSAPAEGKPHLFLKLLRVVATG
jgi:hypothetical protein